MKKIIKILLLSICISLILPPNSSKSIAYTYTSSFTTAPLQPPLRPEEYYPNTYKDIEKRELLVIPYNPEESIIYQSSEGTGGDYLISYQSIPEKLLGSKANYPEVRFLVFVPFDVWNKGNPVRPYRRSICTDTGYFAKVKFTLENNNNAPIQDELKWEIVNVTNEFGGLFRFRGSNNENLTDLIELCKETKKFFVTKELNFWPGLREGAEPEELIKSWPGLFYVAKYSTGYHYKWDHGFNLREKLKTVNSKGEIINGLNAPCNTEVELDLSKGVNIIAIKCWFADPKATYTLNYTVEVQTMGSKPKMEVVPKNSGEVNITMLDNVSLVRDNNPTPPPVGKSYEGDPGPFIVDLLYLTPDEYYPPEERLPYDKIEHILAAYQKRKSKGENVELKGNGVPDWMEVAVADICNYVYFNEKKVLPHGVSDVFKCIWGVDARGDLDDEYTNSYAMINLWARDGKIYYNLKCANLKELRYNCLFYRPIAGFYGFILKKNPRIITILHEGFHGRITFLSGDLKDKDYDRLVVRRSDPSAYPRFIKFSWDHAKRGFPALNQFSLLFRGEEYVNSDDEAPLDQKTLIFFYNLSLREFEAVFRKLATGEKIDLGWVIPFDYPINSIKKAYAVFLIFPQYSLCSSLTVDDEELKELLTSLLESLRVEPEPSSIPTTGTFGYYIPANFFMYSVKTLTEEETEKLIDAIKNKILNIANEEGKLYLRLRVTVELNFPVEELDATYFSIIGYPLNY